MNQDYMNAAKDYNKAVQRCILNHSDNFTELWDFQIAILKFIEANSYMFKSTSLDQLAIDINKKSKKPKKGGQDESINRS